MNKVYLTCSIFPEMSLSFYLNKVLEDTFVADSAIQIELPD